jgi:hypothetical protein
MVAYTCIFRLYLIKLSYKSPQISGAFIRGFVHLTARLIYLKKTKVLVNDLHSYCLCLETILIALLLDINVYFLFVS